MEEQKREDTQVKKERFRDRTSENTYYTAKPTFVQKGSSRFRRQIRQGFVAFLIVAACIAFYFALLRLKNISASVEKLFSVLQPIIWGLVIAYLLNPLVDTIDRYLQPELEKRMKNKKRAGSISRGIGVGTSLLILILCIVMLCNLLIPELYKSIRNMTYTLPSQLNDYVNKVNEMATNNSTTSQLLRTAMNEGSEMLEKWLRNDLLTKTNLLMSNLTLGVINVVNVIVNFLIGLIVSIYIMFSKETFSRQCKKMVYAVFPAHQANMILHVTTKSNSIFGGFIIGKLIDSLIIGILCFFGLSILDMPYVMLISVIIGVTNVIPFFGPYIGAVPSAILIFLSNPMQGLYFLIFILVLQQFDGNILGPKILGNSTGLSAFWVIVAILLGGGLFGFVGMLMGVPTFAVIYYIADMILNHRLESRNLPTDSSLYDQRSYVDNEGIFRDGREEEPEKTSGE